MKCERCFNEPKNSKLMHSHHIVPKEFGGTDEDGRILLCRKCHQLLHRNLLALEISTKEKFIDYTKLFMEGLSEKYIELPKEYMPVCPHCKDEENYMFLFTVSPFKIRCRLCGYIEDAPKNIIEKWKNRAKIKDRKEWNTKYLSEYYKDEVIDKDDSI